jgi:hypothetical protein
MAKYEKLLRRLAVVLAVVAVMALLFGHSGTTVANYQGTTTNEEYVVLGSNGGVDPPFPTAAGLQDLLNNYAQQGWKVRAAATLDSPYIILARPAPNN